MDIVILAGGSGTRLWPLSREKYPKQYLPLAENERSLFIATVERAAAVVQPEQITVVTHRNQTSEVQRHLKKAGFEGIGLLAEPQARNTAPAIGAAALMLMRARGPDLIMAVLPSDHLIPDHLAFTRLMEQGRRAAEDYGLVTYGIKPTYPETGYGYVHCGEKLDDYTYRVEKFVEKPDLAAAEKYLADDRYLWNSGMFVFQAAKLLEQYRLHLPNIYNDLGKIDFEHLETLEAVYGSIEKISIDYGIMERAAGVCVIPANIAWSDLGSWDSYYHVSSRDSKENCFQGRVTAVDTQGSLIIAASRLVGAVGLRDLVVAETADAVLVADRSKSQDVKRLVDLLTEEKNAEVREHCTVHRPWGSFTTLELHEIYQVKRINVNPGSRLSLQSHRHRSESWTVVEGEALVTVGEKEVSLQKGDHIIIPQGARHRVENRGGTELIIIEVQNGTYLGEDDIVRYEDDYGRSEAF